MKLRQDEREQEGWSYAEQDWQNIWDLKLALRWSNQPWLHFSSHTNTLTHLAKDNPCWGHVNHTAARPPPSPPACHPAAISPSTHSSCWKRFPEAKVTRDKAGEEERAGPVSASCSFLQGTFLLLNSRKTPCILFSLPLPAKTINQPCLSGTSSHPAHSASESTSVLALLVNNKTSKNTVLHMQPIKTLRQQSSGSNAPSSPLLFLALFLLYFQVPITTNKRCRPS